MTASEPCRKSRGWLWPLGITAVLGTWVIGDMIFLYVATTHPSYAVEESYLRGDADPAGTPEAQGGAAQAAGWQVRIELTRGAAPGRCLATVFLTDRAGGAALAGATVELATFHCARPREVFRAALTEHAPGQHVAELPLARSGLWDVRVQVCRGQVRFQERASAVLWRP